MTRRITEEADYQGVRIRFRGALGTARVTMKVDAGFGDLVFPHTGKVDYPTLLDLPAPRLLGFSRESAIAEKFQTMIKLGILNSRMRDFLDIWLLSRQFVFDGQVLSTAIRKTFTQRETEIRPNPEAISAVRGPRRQRVPCRPARKPPTPPVPPQGSRGRGRGP